MTIWVFDITKYMNIFIYIMRIGIEFIMKFILVNDIGNNKKNTLLKLPYINFNIKRPNGIEP